MTTSTTAPQLGSAPEAPEEITATGSTRPATPPSASPAHGFTGDPPPEPASAVHLRVTGRNVAVPEHFRDRVAERLQRVERYDPSLHRMDVELQHERNRRQSKSCQRVEITAVGRGPVVRAEACADSFYAALDAAAEKLESRLRRAEDRRRVHHGRHTPVSVAEATAALAALPDVPSPGPVAHEEEPPEPEVGGPGQVVREKEHPAVPMTVDDALYEMELVGHDFFLFHDAATDRPAVVYRRHAFDYGVIRLS